MVNYVYLMFNFLFILEVERVTHSSSEVTNVYKKYIVIYRLILQMSTLHVTV